MYFAAKGGHTANDANFLGKRKNEGNPKVQQGRYLIEFAGR